MKLEDQVCSLDLAKRLKELGVKQEALFSWRRQYHPTRYELDYRQGFQNPLLGQAEIATFTVAELGDMLWEAFEKHGWELLYKVYGETFGFRGTQFIGELGIVNLMRRPDMAAKMLIYLIEKKLITV